MSEPLPSHAEISAALAERPPRPQQATMRLVAALKAPVTKMKTSRLVLLYLGSSLGTGYLAGAFGWLPASPVYAGLAAIPLGIVFRHWRGAQHLARHGVSIEVVVTRDGSELIAAFDLDGVRTVARASAVQFDPAHAGPIRTLVLPGTRPKWVPVLGPHGFVSFEVDPIEMPSAKLLR